MYWLRVVATICCLTLGTIAAAQGQGPEVISLDRAIQAALTNSRDIAAAEHGVTIAGQQVREAWSNVYPDLSASASYQRNLKVQEAFLPTQFFDPNAAPEDVTPVRFGSDNTWNAGLSFTQPLFEYDVFIGVGAASKFRNLETERLRGTTQNVVTVARQAFFGALLATEDERLTRESVERVRQTLEETRALNRAGLASDYDVLRLEVQLANIEPSLRRAENRVRAARRALLIEMGSDPEIDIVMQGSLYDLNIADQQANSEENRVLLAAAGLPLATDLNVDELTSVASGRRTDLRQRRLSMRLEEARLASQKAEFYPTLSFFSNYNIVAQTNGQWFSDFFGGNNTRSTSAVTGVSIQVPIFQGFARSARIQQTHGTLRQLEAQLERAEQEVRSGLLTALEALDETEQRVTSQRRAVEAAQRGFEIASAQYRAGVGSQLQITDAEVALRESEFNYAQAVYDYLIARAQLDATVGTVPMSAGDLTSRIGDRS